MTDQIRGWVVFGLLCSSLVAVLTGCKKETDAAPNAGVGSGSISFATPIGTTSDFFVQVKPLTGMTTYSHEPTSWTTSCKILSTEALQDVRCLVEVPEFDLYFHGLSLQYNFPTAKCAYAEVQPFFYYARPPGLGPSAISMTMRDGVLASFTSSAGVNASAAATSNILANCALKLK